jgi:DNA-binding response OmpR family regulator
VLKKSAALVQNGENHHARMDESDIADENILENGVVELNKAAHTVKVKGADVELTNREFLLLEVLLENENIVMARDILLQKVCGYDFAGETNVIDVYVRYLRSKIDDVHNIKLIHTVRGVGYVIKRE